MVMKSVAFEEPNMHIPRHFNVRVDDSEGEQGDDSR
jgi:hypothetical protein